MSNKITPKNLSYSSSLPPFLAALHAQAAGASSGPDALAAAQRRSAKKRSGSEEAEDAPLVVDEQGNAVCIQVDAHGALVPDAQPAQPAQPAPPPEARKPDAKSAFGGRKRKAGRVVGGDAAEAPVGAAQEPPAGKETRDGGPPAGNKARKKAKKIKLSFDQDEGHG